MMTLSQVIVMIQKEIGILVLVPKCLKIWASNYDGSVEDDDSVIFSSEVHKEAGGAEAIRVKLVRSAKQSSISIPLSWMRYHGRSVPV